MLSVIDSYYIDLHQGHTAVSARPVYPDNMRGFIYVDGGKVIGAWDGEGLNRDLRASREVGRSG
jgi:hypothetical protein